MRALPEPKIDAESRHFYEAASLGQFNIRRCTNCGEPHWYPRSSCPFCFGPTVWEAASGRGEIYSFSVMRKADPIYIIAYVRLIEGPILLTNLVYCSPEDIEIGQAVTLEWVDAGGVLAPCFRPAK